MTPPVAHLDPADLTADEREQLARELMAEHYRLTDDDVRGLRPRYPRRTR